MNAIGSSKSRLISRKGNGDGAHRTSQMIWEWVRLLPKMIDPLLVDHLRL